MIYTHEEEPTERLTERKKRQTYRAIQACSLLIHRQCTNNSIEAYNLYSCLLWILTLLLFLQYLYTFYDSDKLEPQGALVAHLSTMSTSVISY